MCLRIRRLLNRCLWSPGDVNVKNTAHPWPLPSSCWGRTAPHSSPPLRCQESSAPTQAPQTRRCPARGPAGPPRMGGPPREPSLPRHNQGRVQAADVPAVPRELSHSQAPNPCMHTTSGLAVPPSTSASLLDTAHERPGPLVLGCTRTHITRSTGGRSSFPQTVGGRLSLRYELPLMDHERNPNRGSFLCSIRWGREGPPRPA